MLTSALCTHAQLASPDFKRWCDLMALPHNKPDRKDWELAFCAQALFERRCLRPKANGLSFGTGQEELPALFSTMECNIVATDGPEIPEWTETAQHCKGDLTNLRGWGALEDTDRKRITYASVDMRKIPPAYSGKFDFVWSTGSLEHIGTLDLGEEFIENSLGCLVPGGVAVHSTEFAVYPIEDRDNTMTNVYSRKRIEALVERLQKRGRHIHINWALGNSPEDYWVDLVPYREGPAHLKLLHVGVVLTSLGLIIQ